MTRGDYSPRVRSLFADTAHGGDLPANGVNVFRAGASESREGARIELAAVVADGRLAALRYRVYGCPYLIAAAEFVSRRFEGEAATALSAVEIADIMRELDVPVEKTGRILLLEDAIAVLARRIAGGPDANHTNRS